MKKLVIIPTYNERENVSRMISKVMSLFGGYDLLIVDDGSPDGTAAIVRGRQEEFPGRVHLIERSGKLGLGTAYIAGFTAPEGKQMGHAGAIVSGGKGTAQDKKEALEAVGIRVGRTPGQTAEIMREVLASQSL